MENRIFSGRRLRPKFTEHTQVGFIGFLRLDVEPTVDIEVDAMTTIVREFTPEKLCAQQWLAATDAGGQRAAHSGDAVDVIYDARNPQTQDPIPPGDLTLKFRVNPAIFGRLTWEVPPRAPVKYEIAVTAQLSGYVVLAPAEWEARQARMREMLKRIRGAKIDRIT